MAESFWSQQKAELLQDGVFETIEDARMEIVEYIDGYYNIQRRHSDIEHPMSLKHNSTHRKSKNY